MVGMTTIISSVSLCSFRYEKDISFPFLLPLMLINYTQIAYLIEMKNSSYIIRVSKIDFAS